MSAGPGEPPRIATPPRAAPPPPWALPFAWLGAATFTASLGAFLYSYLVRFARVESGSLQLRPILIDAALFSAFAAHHSLLARAGLKARMHRLIHPALERSLYTWTASVLFIAVCAAWRFVPGVAYRVPLPWAWCGYALQFAGVLLTMRATRHLDALDLAGVRPILTAVGSEVPRHVPLRTTGVFGFVRHPLYLGWALFVFGAPEMTMTRLVFALVSTAYVALAIPWEERGLIREFGTPYEEYKRRVRWRMIPGLY